MRALALTLVLLTGTALAAPETSKRPVVRTVPVTPKFLTGAPVELAAFARDMTSLRPSLRPRTIVQQAMARRAERRKGQVCGDPDFARLFGVVCCNTQRPRGAVQIAGSVIDKGDGLHGAGLSRDETRRKEPDPNIRCVSRRESGLFCLRLAGEGLNSRNILKRIILCPYLIPISKWSQRSPKKAFFAWS